MRLQRWIRTVLTYRFQWTRNIGKERQALIKRDEAKLGQEHYGEQIKTIWPFYIEAVQYQRPSAAGLLALMSFFDGSRIPKWVLQAYYYSIAVENITLGSLDEDIAVLRAHLLVFSGAIKGTFRMNPVIRSVVRARLDSSGRAELWQERYLELLAREFPTGEHENWSRCQQLLPHTEQISLTFLASLKSLKAWSQILTNVAWYQWKHGELGQAQNKAEKALYLRLKILGAQDERTIDSMEILAGVLLCQGSFSKAESLNRQALAWRETNLDACHPSVLTTESNLALVLLYLGRYGESEVLHRRNLQRCEESLGASHVDTLVGVSNWSLLLRAQHRYGEAEALNRRALRGFREILGEAHPSTLTSTSNLAVLLQDQGNYEESEKLHRWSVERKLEELGAHHPSTLTSYNNLTSVLRWQNKQEEALKVEEQVATQTGHALSSPGAV